MMSQLKVSHVGHPMHAIHVTHSSSFSSRQHNVFQPVVIYHTSDNNLHTAHFVKDRSQDPQIRQLWVRISCMLNNNALSWIEGNTENEKMQCQTPPLSPPPSHPSAYSPSSSLSSSPPISDSELFSTLKPRRGNLPRDSTAILRAWLDAHRSHPYPTEQEKRELAMKARLTLVQISNWFINARRRYLRPQLAEKGEKRVLFEVVGMEQFAAGKKPRISE
ncbi:uncharacterized protein VTP21DRAFT_8489 [Calcarisporiella thermophila]|uniref:uncharacterized protein n=1 Tax=Calcarisporiella thermophila TaxID=911321 RepID=UPI003743DB3A